ncbi:hypothetical protein A33Q_3876 [Indibacter alkaliphilus LW1]|uniref:Uncharacterized protein n=1 Tax=Indibacter alkaliphilus (strain CCUG 57479 / KCTC 22604 / LW1) TaxID=1189612 RepID=S2DMW9_INDAL|nr:hypothetical protein A33Q_3876 [Indibacter alkaliphilus LW1]
MTVEPPSEVMFPAKSAVLSVALEAEEVVTDGAEDAIGEVT